MDDEGVMEEGVSRPAISETDFDARLRELATLDEQADKLEADLKLVKAEREALSYSLAQYMLTTGCSKKVLDGITFTQKQKVFSKVEDKERLREWILQHDMVDVLMAVHPSKLTAFCNECLEAGTETPEGVNPNYIKYFVHVK